MIIIIIITSFMQGIYTYILETNCVPREYSVAAILLLLFMVLISLVPSGVITLCCGRPVHRLKESPLSTCAPDGHLQV